MQTLVKLTRAFPKETAPYLLPFLQLIWTHLSGFASQYVRQFVLTEEEDDLDAYVDSDGDSVGLETMLFSMLEFVGLATRKKGLKSLMTQGKGTAGEFLNLLCGVLLKYMQMTATMV